jgi:bifunctional non-homologous end joining protein LigD
MTSALERLPPRARQRRRRREQPEWTAPMLAVLTRRRFSDPGWIFERKLDGERCLAFRHHGRLRLLSRTRRLLNDTYPELLGPLESQSSDDFIVDGEIVAFEDGQTSFERLQRRIQLHDPASALRSGIAVFYYLFDILHLDGHDTTGLEQRDRKALLRNALSYLDPLRYLLHRNTEGEALFRDACRKGWEGLIAKRADAVYQHARSDDWLKFKCVNEQEFVIGGWTDPAGTRIGLGALLIGYYDHGVLRYAGKVGTGYSQAVLRDLRSKLDRLEQPEPPFQADGLPRSRVHWVRPELVAQIGFTEVTRDGKLRHPRFLGLRDDKRPREVVLERPALTAAGP